MNWYIFNEIAQWIGWLWVAIWMVLHIRKSVTTWDRFKKLEASDSVQTQLSAALYNRIVALERELYKGEDN